MIRLLHIVAISLLIASAAYAYSTKYETLYYAETLTKTRSKLQKEREAIAVAKAEWALLTRPDRLQRMVDKHLDLQPMGIAQLARLSDIPNRPARADAIAAKLEALGLDPAPSATGGAKKPPAKRDPIASKLDAIANEPSTTGSTTTKRPVKRDAAARPVKRDAIAAKLDSLTAEPSPASKVRRAGETPARPPAR